MIPPALAERLLTARTTVFRCDRRTFAKQQRLPPTVVPTARLLLIERGIAQYHLDGHQLEIGPGDVLLVPAMARRWWQASGASFTMTWNEFLVGDRTPLDLPGARLHLEPAEFAEVLSACRRIAVAHERGGQSGRLLQEAELRALLARVLLSERTTVFSASETTAHSDGAVRAALAWLERHYGDVSPERGLARRVGLSDGHFRTRFRASVGTNARSFVLDLRLHAARRLLAAGSMGIKQVAATVGYRDPLLFSRLYRRRWGVPPSRDGG
ncbi:MAG: helix-turn-helix transcriptional regulator [Planctomycetes bacterium]|nr:helix-turn-helix transcriptional regulator [Planctomycetota bacterium]